MLGSELQQPSPRSTFLLGGCLLGSLTIALVGCPTSPCPAEWNDSALSGACATTTSCSQKWNLEDAGRATSLKFTWTATANDHGSPTFTATAVTADGGIVLASGIYDSNSSRITLYPAGSSNTVVADVVPTCSSSVPQSFFITFDSDGGSVPAPYVSGTYSK